MPFRLMILFRSAVLFAAALFFIRILGKKHPSKMTPFRFVNYAVIAVITALMATNVIESMITGLVALSVWIVFPLIFDYLKRAVERCMMFCRGRNKPDKTGQNHGRKP